MSFNREYEIKLLTVLQEIGRQVKHEDKMFNSPIQVEAAIRIKIIKLCNEINAGNTTKQHKAAIDAATTIIRFIVELT